MNLSKSVGNWLQMNLRELGEDDSTCGSVITGNIDGIPDNTTNRWQFGVDMIYRFVQCGLAIVPYFQIHCVDQDSFFVAIRTLSPFNQSGAMIWNGTFLRGTDGLHNLLKRHFSNVPQYDPNLNPAFIMELEEIFQRHDVPWSDTPLLPITAK